MPHNVKIATCSYCGIRAALVLDRVRHELTCGTCGAPLHELKMLPKQRVEGRNAAVPHRGAHREGAASSRMEQKKNRKSKGYNAHAARKKAEHKRKPKKRWAYELMEELWDVVEDVFDSERRQFLRGNPLQKIFHD